jgi:hypothetical protein
MRLRNESGIALVATLMVIVCMSALIGHQLIMAIASTRTSAADTWDAKVTYAAEGMVEMSLSYLNDFHALHPGDSLDLVSNYSYGNGAYGNAWVIRIDDDSTPGMKRFEIYGHGFNAAGDANLIAARVTITGEPPWEVWAGFVALQGTRKNGNAGKITGLDPCEGNAVPGLLAGDTVWDNNSPVDGTEPWIEGNPPVKYAHQDSLMAMLGFDKWKDMRNDGGQNGFDYVISNEGDWPYGIDFDTYPVIQIRPGSPYMNAAESGKGVLIAPANLEIGGGFTWDGIILVGNELRVNGDVTLTGTVLSALNMLAGEVVNKSDLGNGTKTFTFDMCSVRRALNRLQATVIVHSVREVW